GRQDHAQRDGGRLAPLRARRLARHPSSQAAERRAARSATSSRFGWIRLRCPAPDPTGGFLSSSPEHLCPLLERGLLAGNELDGDLVEAAGLERGDAVTDLVPRAGHRPGAQGPAVEERPLLGAGVGPVPLMAQDAPLVP